MKKLSLKSLTFILALSMGIILSVLPSCKCHEHCLAVVQNGVEWRSMVQHSHDTVVVRDSVFVSERQRGDTVYLTRVEWRDRWRTQLVHDTIVRVDRIVEVIEHPPERYVPPFYKRCTIALWVAIILIILGVLLKSRLRNIM